MGEAPLFSIVTITYQDRPALQKTVESVSCQSFRNFEHIVVDGGSADGTVEWLTLAFDGTWVSEPDGGRYEAMNKGARMSSGVYLWFLNAGDVLGDGTVLSRVAVAVEDDPDWLYGLARVVNPDKSLQATTGFVPFNMFKYAILGRVITHQASAIKREFFWRLGGYDERFAVTADGRFMLRAAHQSPPKAMADFLCDFDSTGISGRRSWWANYWDRERSRRQLATPVTRWRMLDTILSFSYGAIAHTSYRVVSHSGWHLPGRGNADPKRAGYENGGCR